MKPKKELEMEIKHHENEQAKELEFRTAELAKDRRLKLVMRFMETHTDKFEDFNDLPGFAEFVETGKISKGVACATVSLGTAATGKQFGVKGEPEEKGKSTFDLESCYRQALNDIARASKMRTLVIFGI